MKKIHLIIAGMLVMAIALIVYSSDEVSTYGTFDQAETKGDATKIVGSLVKAEEIYYEPSKDPNYFSFTLQDENGRKEKVVMMEAKPRDFEMSEQVVITGRFEDAVFKAEDMLLKCPSKYKEEELYIQSGNQAG